MSSGDRIPWLKIGKKIIRFGRTLGGETVGADFCAAKKPLSALLKGAVKT